jgi:Fe-S cluster assembly scaffold IscU
MSVSITKNFRKFLTYSSKIIEHYETPRNVGSLPKNDKDVGVGLVGAPACGDVLLLSIRVDKNTGTITDALFKTFGCGSAIASSSYTTEVIKGMNLNEAKQVTNSLISKHLKLPPVKLHCSMLAEDAIKAAINDYKKKQKNK